MNNKKDNQIADKAEVVLDDRTNLAVMRTRLAAERTLMSWIRTSFSLITFGFALLKFYQYLYLSGMQVHRVTGMRHLGIFLILLGIFSLVPGLMEHRKDLLLLKALDKRSISWSYTYILAILVVIVGLYALSSALAIRIF